MLHKPFVIRIKSEEKTNYLKKCYNSNSIARYKLIYLVFTLEKITFRTNGLNKNVECMTLAIRI